MDTDKKVNLYIINTNYPFGKTETFLENEIKFISKYFNEVHLFPLNYPSKDFFVRRVPENVIFHNVLLDKLYYKRVLKFIFKFSPIKMYLIDLKNVVISGNGHFMNKLKRWFLSTLVHRAFYNSDHFRFIKNNINEHDVLYFYWGSSRCLFAPIFNHPKTFIRIHGGEIDLERHNNYIPFLNKLFTTSSTFLPISNRVKDQISKFSPETKALVNRLGTFDLGLGPKIKPDQPIRIVSCSDIITLKRVHLIIEALKHITDIEVEWVHFGDGVLSNQILSLASDLDANITAVLKGRVLNTEVMDFYKNNYVNLFINVSTTEGVPVSIMEALSFGIPCFATDVGATSELVNNTNGRLVQRYFEIEDLKNCIINSNSDDFRSKRIAARTTWEDFCNAEKNYLNLVRLMN